jgi:hypothetical protein
MSMAVVGSKEPLGEKQAKDEKKYLEKYGLGNLSPEDLIILKKITTDLFASKWFKASQALRFAKVEEQAEVAYLNTLVEQNWLIIKKLDEISRKLTKQQT